MSRGTFKRPLPPIELLRELLELDEETGQIKDRGFRCKGGYPGRVNSYVRVDKHGRKDILIAVKSVQYKANRIAWALHHGRDPGNAIVDHINGDTMDNRPSNLRLTDALGNAQNSKERKSLSGVRGVQWKPRSKKWAARISIRGRLTHLGLFESLDEAGAAYREAQAREHGEFVRRTA